AGQAQAPRGVDAIGVVGNSREVAAETYLESAAEHALVAGEPAETHFGGNGERGVGDGAFRGPESGGGAAEAGLMEAPGAGELLTSVLGMDERRGELGRAGIGFQGRAGVAEERQDGMVERGSGDFDLAALRGPGVFGQHAAEEFELFLSEGGFV